MHVADQRAQPRLVRRVDGNSTTSTSTRGRRWAISRSSPRRFRRCSEGGALIRPHLRVVPSEFAPAQNLAGLLDALRHGGDVRFALLGFAREVVNAKFYGTQWEMDTFLAAATIPTILFGVFNGALVSALVPTFTDYIAKGREDEAWLLGNTVVNLLAIVLTVRAVSGT